MKREFLQFSEISRHDDSILENFNKMESSCKFSRKIVKIVPFWKLLAFLASQTPRFRPVLTTTGVCETRLRTCKFQCQVRNTENDSKILSQFLKVWVSTLNQNKSTKFSWNFSVRLQIYEVCLVFFNWLKFQGMWALHSDVLARNNWKLKIVKNAKNLLFFVDFWHFWPPKIAENEKPPKVPN